MFPFRVYMSLYFYLCVSLSRCLSVSLSFYLSVGLCVRVFCAATTAVLLLSEPTAESGSWLWNSHGLEFLLSAVAPMTSQVD